MTTEQLQLTNLDRQITAAERLIRVKYEAALTEQLTRFRAEMDAAKTTEDKLEVVQWWMEWLVS